MDIGTIDLKGGQITFPATENDSGDANTLDDYEEGTWTMGIEFGNGTTGIAYGSNTGYYTRVGNVVTISGYLALTNKGSSTGAARITGLPFTVYNNTGAWLAAGLRCNAVTFANQYAGYIPPNEAEFVLAECTEGGVTTNLEDSDCANNSTFDVGGTYRVA